MPGGQSASALGASLEVLERSMGASTSIFAAGLGFGATATGTGFDTMAGFIDEIEAVAFWFGGSCQWRNGVSLLVKRLEDGQPCGQLDTSIRLLSG